MKGVGTPKAGVFAPKARRRLSPRRSSPNCAAGRHRKAYKGQGSCYIEFGPGKVGRVDVDGWLKISPVIV